MKQVIMMASDKQAVTQKASPVVTSFALIVSEIQTKIDAAQMKSAVDIELTFNQVSLDARGIPLFTRHKEQSQMQIKLATRIMPGQ